MSNQSPKEQSESSAFMEFLGGAIRRPWLSPENRERVALVTEPLMYSGFAHAILGGVFLSENPPEMLGWTILAPMVLWVAGGIARRDLSLRADTMVALTIGFTSVGVEGLLKMGQFENSRLLAATVFGGYVLLGAAAATGVQGRHFVRQLIHPQLPPEGEPYEP